MGGVVGRIVPLLLLPCNKKMAAATRENTENGGLVGNGSQNGLQVCRYTLSVNEKELIWVNVYSVFRQDLPKLSSSIYEIQYSLSDTNYRLDSPAVGYNSGNSLILVKAQRVRPPIIRFSLRYVDFWVNVG